MRRCLLTVYDKFVCIAGHSRESNFEMGLMKWVGTSMTSEWTGTIFYLDSHYFTHGHFKTSLLFHCIALEILTKTNIINLSLYLVLRAKSGNNCHE